VPASARTLAAQWCTTGARQVSGGSGWRGVRIRGEERELACARGVLAASSPTRVS
jgi:hypothetical protein